MKYQMGDTQELYSCQCHSLSLHRWPCQLFVVLLSDNFKDGRPMDNMLYCRELSHSSMEMSLLGILQYQYLFFASS